MKREIHKSLLKGQKPHVSITYDTENPVDMVRMVARERYAWPGGYELLAITSDGGLLCSTCVRENYRQIIEHTKDKIPTGWDVVAVITEAEVEEDCSHCGKALGYC